MAPSGGEKVYLHDPYIRPLVLKIKEWLMKKEDTSFKPRVLKHFINLNTLSDTDQEWLNMNDTQMDRFCKLLLEEGKNN